MELSLPRLAERLTDEAAAWLFLEELRWAGKPVCAHCGSDEKCYFLTPREDAGRKTRTGSRTQRRLWKCGVCKKQFTAMTNTIFHGSKVPLRTWMLIVFDVCTAKNGISSREIERKYDLTTKTAWFVAQRLREAMRRDPIAGMLTGEVEVDETYLGPKVRGGKRGRGAPKKTAIVTLISRESGEARSQPVERVTSECWARCCASTWRRRPC
jgi:Transposase zinc-ribbon domain/ISXO2-like transposase domain